MSCGQVIRVRKQIRKPYKKTSTFLVFVFLYMIIVLHQALLPSLIRFVVLLILIMILLLCLVYSVDAWCSNDV